MLGHLVFQISLNEILTVDIDHEFLIVSLVMCILVLLLISVVDFVDRVHVHSEKKLDIVLLKLILAERRPIDIDVLVVWFEDLHVEQIKGLVNLYLLHNSFLILI